MKILVFGASGQVGREVCRAAWPSRYVVLPFDRKALDISRSAAVDEILRRERPDLVINLAAYTAVDRAESEPEAAWAANCAGAAHLAAACGEGEVPLAARRALPHPALSLRERVPVALRSSRSDRGRYCVSVGLPLIVVRSRPPGYW